MTHILQTIIDEINDFEADCRADEFTNTSEVWVLLKWIRATLRAELDPPPGVVIGEHEEYLDALARREEATIR